ncbi:MAG: AAA family ATPase [Acidobacteriota bacterium]|nr:AAA family ATPase [Acidobacteriota bacterium]
MAFLESGDENGKRNGKHYQHTKYKKGKQYCPVCTKTNDWYCGITEDEGLAYCSYISSDKTDKFGRYLHILKDTSKTNLKDTDMTAIKESNEIVKADADRLDKVYTALLENLELNEEHSNDLLNRRGLKGDDLMRNFYASVPDYTKRFEIANQLAKSFNLENVPGFYQDNGRWCLNMTFSGFYIPYRDETGRIVGLQIRRDEDVENKYMWVSSAGKEKGASSGSPIHFVNPETVKERKVVFLTEGALKADIIGSISGVGLVASAGVSAVNPKELLNSIYTVFPDLEKIVIAYDMDWETNGNVRLALGRLLDTLKEKYVEVYVATWDRSLGKGLDDILVNKDTPDNAVKYILAKEFQDNLASVMIEESTDEILVTESFGDEIEQDDFEESEQNSLDVNQEYDFNENEIMHSWGELATVEFEDTERVMFGLMRGNLGLFVASTNLGKTTLALNLALSATAGNEFYPLLNQTHTARKILYIDGEATKPELQTDIRKMLEVFTPQQVESVKKNLFLICDEELDDEPLDLVNPEHQEIIKQKALACNPDLIIVDTLSALMDIEDENDNAKVKKEVMKPLKKLAKQTNSAILLLHHTGKYNEGFSPTGAYKGRGASAFGGLSRSVFTLEKGKLKGNKVKLSCPKVKGDEFNDSILELDQNSRWFKVINDTAIEAPSENQSGYEQVIRFVKMALRDVKRNEIVVAFNGKDGKPFIAPSTITKHLSNAVKEGRLDKSRNGYYSAPKSIEIEAEIPLAS